jgi:acetyl-CoA carboxylase carboxyl transferase subunit alpha
MALEFEKPILELEQKIAELQKVKGSEGINIDDEITRMKGKIERLLVQTYSKLTPQQKVHVARHPDRPHCKDYIKALITDFTPLAGDRLFAEDHAMVSGIGRFEGQSCIILGQEKGSDTESRIHHNFGMARPEGYRKAQRLIKMANQFRIPVLTFIDTSGAYPGIGAEERGQSEAIAKSIEACLEADVPVITTVIGEGGSGGAIAIGVANAILMLEHAIYSVISPEGCASILWRSAEQAEDAANALKLTAQDLLELKIIDEIVPEPLGGAHRNRDEMFKNTRTHIRKNLQKLVSQDAKKLKKDRHEKFMSMSR